MENLSSFRILNLRKRERIKQKSLCSRSTWKKRKKQTEYGLQLAEKQKVRHMYGVNEKQFHNTFNQAGKRVNLPVNLLVSTSTKAGVATLFSKASLITAKFNDLSLTSITSDQRRPDRLL